jgi:hypothetical protein
MRVADLFHSSILNECRDNHFAVNDLRLVVEASSTSLPTDFTDEVLDSALKVLKSGAWVLTKEGVANRSPYLRFDGRSLCWIGATGKSERCWTAVSGKAGFTGKEHQEAAFKGPLPVGWWLAQQSEYQAMSSADAAKGVLGRGKWPGGVPAWGAHRIWLKPAAGTNTLGRSGFSIHGGWEAGSAGCIDLTSSIGEFVTAFRKHGKDMELIVEY